MFFSYIFIVNISDLATKHTHTYPTLFLKQTFTTGWMIYGWMDRLIVFFICTLVIIFMTGNHNTLSMSISVC